MPALRIIETDALNAFASGIRKGNYSVTVTRGLINELDGPEIEGVLAHELTHIRNHDVQLLVITQILVGIVPIVHNIAVRAFWLLIMFILTTYRAVFTLLPVPGLKALVTLTYNLLFLAGKGVAFVIGVIGQFCSLIISFALSRRREFMADAGAVELTNNPDAMISALRKIAGRSDVPTTIDGVREMFFDNPHLAGIEGLFATHPPIEKRIDALIRYARDVAPPDAQHPKRTVSQSARLTAPIRRLEVDYYPLLVRAVANLSPNTHRTRSALYDRVRQLLLKQLASFDPTFSGSEIDAEQFVLEDSIRRIEAHNSNRPEELESLAATRAEERHFGSRHRVRRTAIPVFVVVTLAVGGGSYLYFDGTYALYAVLGRITNSNNPSPSSAQNTQGGVSGARATELAAVSPPAASSVATSKAAVAAAFRSQIHYSAEPITPYGNVIVGDYALQGWGGQNTGGEALLKYDAAQSRWNIVSSSGGALAVDDLSRMGVPLDTATTLVLRCCSRTQGGTQDAQSFVWSFYDWYLHGVTGNLHFTTSAEFKSSLPKLLSADFIRNWQKIIDTTDVDPLLLTQDQLNSWISNIKTVAAYQSATTSTVLVSLGTGSETYNLRVHLTFMNNAWLISSVTPVTAEQEEQLIGLAQTPHRLQDKFTDPAAYCRAVQTIDAPDERYNGPKYTQQMRAVTDAFKDNDVTWRCLDGKVLACALANTTACGKAPWIDQHEYQPLLRNPEIIADCRNTPNAECVGATHCIIGCNGTAPKINRNSYPIDARGFAKSEWKPVIGPSESLKPPLTTTIEAPHRSGPSESSKPPQQSPRCFAFNGQQVCN